MYQTGHYSSVIQFTQSNIDWGTERLTISLQELHLLGFSQAVPLCADIWCVQCYCFLRSKTAKNRKCKSGCKRNSKSLWPAPQIGWQWLPAIATSQSMRAHIEPANSLPWPRQNRELAIRWHASTQRSGQWTGALSWTKLRHPKLSE